MSSVASMSPAGAPQSIASPLQSIKATSSSNPSQSSSTPTSIQRLASAATGATLVALLVTPFDVIKTRMQSDISATSKPDSIIFDQQIRQQRTAFQCFKENVIHKGASVKQSGVLGLEATSSLRPFKSTMDGFIRIWHYEGIPALWKGLTPALLMQAPSTVFYYLGYEEIKHILIPYFPESSSNLYAPLLAGSLARTATTMMISPLELIRTRMQSGSGSDTTLKSVVMQLRGMVATSGVQSLWRGLGPTLWRDVPFSAIYWVGYEGIRKRLTEQKHVLDVGEFGGSFLAGATAGTVAAILTTPFDVAKTLQQVVHHDEPGCVHHPGCGHLPGGRKLSMVNVMRSIVANDGVKGLFVGLSPRIAKIAPACAIMISSYELGKRAFERMNRRQ
ncbi:mitochondrial carrier domain-containing protein [Obelidium mucronatum]|nr:mitochondrial carrier domain-containing protein [Obelidium mucronatum]